MHTTPQKNLDRESAILVGVRWQEDPSTLVDDHLDELELLADTAGADTLGRVVQARQRPDPSTFIGRGKVESLINQSKELECDLIIFDDELSPSQHKNLQKQAGEDIKVIDRSGLILHIFAKHARSREAKTQVELARLQYMMPRLSGQWTHLERQKGGIGTRGGMGESQIEVDRRITRDKIRQLEGELKKIAAEHKTQASRRGSACQIALVGYTNAGKSTLMNSLTDADVFVEDRLFATLDTTTRKIQLAEYQALISDTVGFIRKLPHHLVASFRTTLSEVREANVILKVLDASSPQVEEHYITINEVMSEMELVDQSELIVLNKIDLIDDANELDRLRRLFPNAVEVSAAKRLKLDVLEAAIIGEVEKSHVEVELRVPHHQSKMISEMYESLKVGERQYENDVVVIRVSGSQAQISQFQRRLEKPRSH